MTTQEKVALNLSAMDLAKIDFLVEQGYYSSRSDFMRQAIRNQLKDHDAVISDASLVAKLEATKGEMDGSTIGGVGVYNLSRPVLEGAREQKRKLHLFVIGAVVVDKNIDLELVREVIQSARIYGTLKGPKDVTDYLKQLSR